MPPPDHSRCPTDPQESAELYLLHMLTPEDATAFEDHYMTCPECGQVVEETDAYVRAMKGAAQRLAQEREGTK